MTIRKRSEERRVGKEFKINQVAKRVVLFYYLIKAKGLLYRTLKVKLRILLY